MVMLRAHGKLKGKALDYGCGKGFDAQYYGLDKYDPHYYPNQPTGQYDVITCNYVLNVVDPSEVVVILSKIRHLLADNGVAYLTVRRDIVREGHTSKGTYQYNVKLNLPIVKENSRYCIYKLSKQ